VSRGMTIVTFSPSDPTASIGNPGISKAWYCDGTLGPEISEPLPYLSFPLSGDTALSQTLSRYALDHCE
jgi:hypothetical protein